MTETCTCGHVRRIHGRPWIPDDHCRAYNPRDGQCPCDDFTAKENS